MIEKILKNELLTSEEIRTFLKDARIIDVQEDTICAQSFRYKMIIVSIDNKPYRIHAYSNGLAADGWDYPDQILVAVHPEGEKRIINWVVNPIEI